MNVRTKVAPWPTTSRLGFPNADFFGRCRTDCTPSAEFHLSLMLSVISSVKCGSLSGHRNGNAEISHSEARFAPSASSKAICAACIRGSGRSSSPESLGLVSVTVRANVECAVEGEPSTPPPRKVPTEQLSERSRPEVLQPDHRSVYKLEGRLRPRRRAESNNDPLHRADAQWIRDNRHRRHADSNSQR